MPGTTPDRTPRAGAARTRPDTEALLLERVARRDEAALIALYERVGATVHACCLRILGDPDEAKDATSLAFWRIWQRSGDFVAGQGSGLAWILTVSRRLALDQRRSRMRRDHTLARLETLQPADDAARGPGIDAATRLAVSTALSRLSAADRVLLESAYFEGLSGTDIARRDDVPLGTVKSRMRAALRRLRIALHGGMR